MKATIKSVVSCLLAVGVCCLCYGCVMQDGQQNDQPKKGRYNLLNTNGELSKKFIIVFEFADNGLAMASDEFSEGLYGYIDINGNWVIEPQFDECETFAYGYAVACLDKDEGWGIIDESGQWALEPRLGGEASQVYEPCKIASEEHIVVLDTTTADTYSLDSALRYGYADFTGALITEIKYKECNQFSSCGLALVQDGETRLYGYVDKQGNEVIPPTFRNAESFSDDGFAWVKNETGLYGVIDTTGSWKIEPTYSYIKKTPFSDLNAVKDTETNLWGFVGAEGTWVISPSYTDATDFAEDGTACVDDPATGLRGVINKTGEWVIEPRYVSDGEIYAGLDGASMKDVETGLYGLIDESGEWIDEPKYTVFGSFSPEGIAVVSESSAESFKDDRESYYFIDRNGNPLFDMTFDFVPSGFRSGVAIVSLPDAEREYE